MRMKILLDNETEQELLYRSNYLGVSLSSIVLLHLVLYQRYPDLSREDFKRISTDKCRSLQIDVKDEVIKKFDSRPRYDNSISMLLSVFILKITKETKDAWKDIKHEEKFKMAFSTYSIAKEVIDEMKDVKQKTGLTFTTIINYAALMDVDAINQLSLFSDSNEKKQQGFQLSEKAIEKIQGQALSQDISVGNLLEIKLEKALKRLA
ncbi:hypothetical protein DTX80_17725 [Bacilli bacterium]|nr:hypothetical protein WH51_11480 [Bacilli bacterium VT-13-104]PZD83165.1 hypothetical protein DEJ64_15965 [Bacilli bacterium]PZD84277.1 hypothetical protein DEJ60_14985 [Bacilli bacterium]PZD86302.1 hypothetical protein DEJ66_15695 [Bacilli bacterium]RCO04289.1 hypothetical protein DTX80_17725 [Bacilli bacterium]